MEAELQARSWAWQYLSTKSSLAYCPPSHLVVAWHTVHQVILEGAHTSGVSWGSPGVPSSTTISSARSAAQEGLA
eukprot:4767001-Alexandrium_andersonii.AAC.1